MFSHPKFLWFAVIFFGLCHIIGYMLDGYYRSDMLDAPSAASVVQIVLFDYEWIGGKLNIFKWILNVVEAVCLALIAIEGLSRILGAIRR